MCHNGLWFLISGNQLMKCPYCASTNTRVADKRDNNDEGITRRRRECQECFKRFTTFERIEKIELDVIKRDGNVEKFNREKLKRGLMRSVNKRSVEESQIDRIVDDIEMKLLNRKTTLIRSKDIGKLALSRLKNIDDVAYMCFASVYRDFESIEDFKDELNLLKDKNATKGKSPKKGTS